MRKTPSHRSKLNTTCVLVRSGSFQVETASLHCTPCPAGSYVAAKGSTACSPCSAGGYCEEVGASSASVFQLCQPGTWSDTIGLNSSNGCQKCPIGTHQPVTGANSSGSCLPCPMGTMSATLGVPSCLRCKPGTFQGKEGQLACEPCPISSYCTAGSSAPTACQEGTIGPREGLSSDQECEPCPKGAWCSAGKAIPCGSNTFQPGISQDNAGACQQCPEHAVSPKASTSIEDCKCEAGYYDSGVEITSVTCKPCFAGSMCGSAIGTTIKTLPLRECYYRVSSTSDDLRRCPDCDHTSGCAGGVGKGEGPCKDWLMGPYCQLCNVSDRSRYYDSEQSACVVCKVDAVAPLLRACGLILLVVVIVLLFWRFKPYRRVPLLARLARWFMRLFVQLSLRSKAKQLLGFYQIATRIGDVYKVGFLMISSCVMCCVSCADYALLCAYTLPAMAVFPLCLLCLLCPSCLL